MDLEGAGIADTEAALRSHVAIADVYDDGLAADLAYTGIFQVIVGNLDDTAGDGASLAVDLGQVEVVLGHHKQGQKQNQPYAAVDQQAQIIASHSCSVRGDLLTG